MVRGLFRGGVYDTGTVGYSTRFNTAAVGVHYQSRYGTDDLFTVGVDVIGN